SNLFATMDARFASQGGRATWVAKFQQCFNRWQALSGLSYQRITVGGNDWDDGANFHISAGQNGTRGDIRIGMRTIDGGGGILAFNNFPSDGDMTLDAADGGNFASANGDFLFLRNTVMHEHGHGIGLAHVCPSNATKLMEPFISTNYDGPQHDDIRAAHKYY